MKLLWMAVLIAVLAGSLAVALDSDTFNLELKIEKVTLTDNGFQVTVRVKNVGKFPVRLALTGFNVDTLQSIDVEQWDEELGWQTVGPCYDVPPSKTMTLRPGDSFTENVPISDLSHGFHSAVCPRKIQQLQGSIRAVVRVWRSHQGAQNRRRLGTSYKSFYSPAFTLPPDAVRILASRGNPTVMVQPVYPDAAKKAGLQGVVLLDVVVGESGNVQEVSVLSGTPLLVKSAVDAVRQWRYKRILQAGKPVKYNTTVTVRFKLPKKQAPSVTRE